MAPRRFLTFSLISIISFLIIFTGMMIDSLLTPVIKDNQGFHYIVPQGASLEHVRLDLERQGVIKHPLFFKWYSYFTVSSNELKAGEYFFPKGSTPISIIKQIKSGTGMVYHVFTIIPGWTFRQIKESLARNPSVTQTIQKQNDAGIMKQMGFENLPPEGQFYPDSYYFTYGTEDIVLLKKAFKKMQNKLNDAWQDRDKNIPYKTSYEALIVASLIEKETRLLNEKKKISGVILNRLQKNMLLQIDPTVIYGLGTRYDGVIHKSDLTFDTPFNTYIHKGLPPTPIASPTMDSIIAAVHPERHGFFYFVAKGDGSHKFTASLDEHHLAVNRAKEYKAEFFNTTLLKKYISIRLQSV